VVTADGGFLIADYNEALTGDRQQSLTRRR